MLSLGIVGHAQDKFTSETERIARHIIRNQIVEYDPEYVVSGRCPKGGIDIWAEEIAKELDVATLIFPPKVNRWDGPGGYKERNLKIAESTLVLCIVIAHVLLPQGVRDWGNGICYHCRDRNPPHVKSGGCWTAWKCKDRKWIIIDKVS